MARRATADKHLPVGVRFVREMGGISEYTLDKNGLQILLAPDASVPVAGVMVTYHVGSRNEATGHTGATHLLEHLMFKGSKNFNKDNGGVVWNLLENKGARINATTWYDRTNYYEIFPKELLTLTLTFEADRMQRSFIHEADRVSEMPVVRSEFEIGENNPLYALEKELWAAAFQAHPYHHSTIGWKSDIEQVPIERLQQFYRDFYRPDNATLTVVGDFDVREALETIAREFGAYARPEKPIPAMYTTEPKQEGERRVVVRRAGDTNMVGVGYKIPAGTDTDLPALIMLGLVLTDGKTSRLHRALVDTALATEVSSECYQLRDPALFTIYATLAPRQTHVGVETRIKKLLNEIAAEGVMAAELARAKQTVRAYLASRRDGPYALLAAINEEIAVGDWTRFVLLPDALARVTPKQVQAAAKKYLVEDQSTVGYFIGKGI